MGTTLSLMLRASIKHRAATASVTFPLRLTRATPLLAAQRRLPTLFLAYHPLASSSYHTTRVVLRNGNSSSSNSRPSLNNVDEEADELARYSMTDFYSLKAEKASGEIDFATLKGKVVLIFNSATKCGFTPQLAELQELHKKYADKGLVLLGFPSNEFGGQNPEDDEGGATFCQRNYGVDFTMAKKGNVNGKDASEVWKWLKSQKKGLLGSEFIKWNFTKFLINKDGQVVERYSPTATPSSFEPTIVKLLEEAKSSSDSSGNGTAQL